jgi:hypothetical protein
MEWLTDYLTKWIEKLAIWLDKQEESKDEKTNKS